MRPSPSSPTLSSASSTTSGVRPANGGDKAAPSILDRDRVEAAPQIPRCHRAPWPPGLGERAHRLAIEALASVVVVGERTLQTDVIDGQHVGAQLVEHQEHLRRPAADALDVDQLRDERLVIERPPALGVETTGGEMGGQIGEVFGLALRQSAGAQRRQLLRANALRCQARKTAARGVAYLRDEALPYGLGGLDRNLLADDCPRKRGEGIA